MEVQLSNTVEDYLKIIYEGTEESKKELISLGTLAHSLNLTAGTVTTMVKRIAADGLLIYKIRRGCCLTEKGLDYAVDIIRKHRILEYFLVNTLGMDWSEVHEEAEQLEHALSGKLLQKLEEFLGFPTEGPHGYPIPKAGSGNPDTPFLLPLSMINAGAICTIRQVDESDSERLQFLGSCGLYPGVSIHIVAYSSAAETLTVSASDKPSIVLGLGVASHIFVSPGD